MATMLIVDDEESVRGMFKRVLKHKLEEFTLLEASSGEEALLIVNTTGIKVDLILTDLAMRGMGGIQLVDMVCATHPEISTVLITAHLIKKAEHKANHYLQKPISNDELASAVVQVSGGKFVLKAK